MANVFPTDWDLYKYDVDVTIELPLSSGKKTNYELNHFQIANLLIEKNFDDDIFPILMIDLMLPRSIYYKIINNKSSKIILVVSKYIKTTDGMSYKETIIERKFTPVISDDGSDINADMYNSMKSDDGLSNTDLSDIDMNSVYTFILTMDNDITHSKTIVNTVLSNVTVTTALLYLLLESGFSDTDILMSSVDNLTLYDQLILLPVSLVDQLEYINNMYGVYKEGMQFFKDFSILYLIRKTGLCTTYTKNEIKNITFVVSDKVGSMSSMSNGINKDRANSKVYMSLKGDQLNISDVSNVIDNTSGMNTEILQVETGEIISIFDNTRSSVSTSISHSKFIKDEIKLRKTEMSHVINITIDDIDISLLTPNKEYKFITGVSDMRDTLSGTYRICKMQSVFNKDEMGFKCSTVATFKRTNDR